MQFLHGFELLLSLHTSIVKSLIFLFDALYLPLHFLLPVGIFELTTFVIFILEFPVLFKFVLLFALEGGLLDRFVK